MADDPYPDALDDEFEPLPAPDMEAIRTALQRESFKECPVCGDHRWSMPDGTNTVMAGYGPGGEAAGDFGYGFAAAIAICEGCGFVRMHHVGRLLG